MKLATVRQLLQGLPAEAEVYCEPFGGHEYGITSIECIQLASDDPIRVILRGTYMS